MKSKKVILQEWLSAAGATGWTGILQEVEDWLNTEDYDSAVVQVELPAISGATLYIEGCDQSGGSFVTHKALDAATSGGATVVTLLRQAPYGSASKLSTLMRWRVTGPGSPSAWSATFRVSAVFKK